MCGICGAFDRTRERVQELPIREMTATLGHRGPDGEGFHQDARTALGFRRLAVLDLSEFGNQPHQNAEGTVLSVLNGQIYNYRELRRDLLQAGCVLRSHGDAEILPHLYAAHGDDFIHMLRGMFALAILDLERHRLILARDRYGKKPLYYTQQDDLVRFASEPRALLVGSKTAVEPDPANLMRFLCLGAIPSPGSAFAGLRRLPAASMLVVEKDDIREELYWQPSAMEQRVATSGERDELGDDLYRRLLVATNDRLESDVPWGVLLSGGIDSGLVLAAATESNRAPPPTFTIAFEDARYDERALARATAKRLGSEHQVHVATLSGEDALNQIASTYDEPFGDPSAWPTLLLCRFAREHVKVVMSGDGGDELFAGYPRYRALQCTERLERLVPCGLLARVAGLVGEAANGTGGRSLLGRLRRLLSVGHLSAEERFLYWITFFRAPLRARWLHPEFLEQGQGVDPDHEVLELLRGGTGGPVRRAQRYDVERYLRDDLLVKMDTASMACGLEVRSPFLDHRLLEWVMTVPEEALVGGGTTKPVLRAAARSRLPAAVRKAKKRGLGVPLADWLRGPLRATAERALLSDRFDRRRILREGAARELLGRHLAGREDWSSYLWLLLILEYWMRRFVDGDSGSS